MSGSCPSHSSLPDLASLSKRSCKCPPNKEPGRNLVICIDGTSNTIEDNTHVFELYNNIVEDDQTQLAYYTSGVGTQARFKGFVHTKLVKRVSRILDLAVAHDIKQNIVDAYGWLSDRYHDGDKIFLFGFSRGAYQVRALAGMIHEVGLITPENKDRIPRAFQYYSTINSGKAKDIQRAKEFKRANSRNVVIHFVGVWDTVSSVGVNRTNILPSTDTCDHICYFRQALALDERRVKFQPEYVYGSMSDESNWFKYQESAPHPTEEDPIKEVWFASSHSDVGGGSWNKTSHPHDLRNMPLLWMRDEVRKAGLLLHPRNRYGYEEFQEYEITDSLTLAWWLLEMLPIRYLCYNSNTHKRQPHFGKGRIIMPGQKIHESVLFRPNYRPKGVCWKNVQQWLKEAQTASARGRLSQLDSALELLPLKGSTAEALDFGVSDKQIPDTSSLALKCSFAVKKIIRKMLEAMLGVGGKIIGGAEPARDEERLMRLGAFVAYCELGTSNSQKCAVENKDIKKRMQHNLSDFIIYLLFYYFLGYLLIPFYWKLMAMLYMMYIMQ
ncbi:uncharacterized protein EDB91DRAFT_1170774 [Suillus paluster]|uniref:uncharacterized protein n=1 Tax=Suillus paluster TaxID=48578 RepID=UPI001B87C265|nr:uncharacterized protein EDB91DRAFT_1170774 [Suillus paluster]KAG1724516.1 hypothetical protein EDB91DRAFT_1170774 [Suillus paluster]